MSNLISILRDSRDSYSEKLRQLLVNCQKYPEKPYFVYMKEKMLNIMASELTI